MSTRFYFDTARAAGVAPAYDSSWEITTGAPLRGQLTPDPAGVLGGAIAANSAAVAAAPRDMLVQGFVSNPLPAQTLSGTFSLIAMASESAAGADMFLQVVIRVVSGNGSTVRGIAYAGNATTSVSATPSLALAYEFDSAFPRSRGYWNFPLSPVSVQAGDRIVVELGARSTSAAVAPNGNLRFNAHELATDMLLLPDRGYQAAYPERAWIEFSGNLLTPLAAEEFRYKGSGVVLNGPVSLPFVDLTSVDGLDNAPVGHSSADFEGRDGGYNTAEFETSRTITLSGDIYAPVTGLETYLDTLKENFAPTRRYYPLYFGTDLEQRQVFAKCLGIRFAKSRERSVGKVPFQVQFVCGDPRIYGLQRTFQNIPISGSATTVNISGNRATSAKIGITGGLTGGVLYISNIGYNASFALPTLTGTDTLAIELASRQVVKNVTENARSSITLTGEWPLLTPGDNSLRLAGTGANAFMTVEYLPAWR